MVTKVDTTQFPEFTAAKNRLAKCQHAWADHRATVKDILAQQRGVLSGKAEDDRLTIAAVQFLNSTDAKPLVPANIAATLDAQMREGAARGSVLYRAVEIAEKQVDAARSAASCELAAKLTPEYTAILRRMKKALLDLRAVALDEAGMRAECEAAGFGATFGSYLRAMPFAGSGFVHPGDVDEVGIIDLWLAELKSYYPSV